MVDNRFMTVTGARGWGGAGRDGGWGRGGVSLRLIGAENILCA